MLSQPVFTSPFSNLLHLVFGGCSHVVFGRVFYHICLMWFITFFSVTNLVDDFSIVLDTVLKKGLCVYLPSTTGDPFKGSWGEGLFSASLATQTANFLFLPQLYPENHLELISHLYRNVSKLRLSLLIGECCSLKYQIAALKPGAWKSCFSSLSSHSYSLSLSPSLPLDYNSVSQVGGTTELQLPESCC